MSNAKGILTQWLSLAIDEDMLTRICDDLGHAIEKASIRIENAHSIELDDFASAITDQECELIEALLGAAFVVCQAAITSVVSCVKRISEHVYEMTKSNAGIPSAKADIMKIATRALVGKSFTPIEAINAFANYFKHRDEWRVDWAMETGQSKATIALISTFGLQSGSSGNLRAAAASLGNEKLVDVRTMAAPILAWHKNLVILCKNKMTAAGL